MCEWTDKYPLGSEHWLFGRVINIDPGDGKPLCFDDIGWAMETKIRECESEEVMLNKFLDKFGVDVVLKALEQRIGVPESVHWTTLKVGDTVEVVDKPHRDDVRWIRRNPGPYEVFCLESDDYEGTMPIKVMSMATGESHWLEICGIKGVHGDS